MLFLARSHKDIFHYISLLLLVDQHQATIEDHLKEKKQNTTILLRHLHTS